MKSIKQNPISTKGPDRGKIVLHIIDNTWVYLIIFFSKKPDMKFITADSRYLEFDGTMEKIWVNRSSTQEELRIYRKCSLFNDERETTRAKFWRAKTSKVPILRMILSLFDVFVAVFFPFYYNC